MALQWLLIGILLGGWGVTAWQARETLGARARRIGHGVGQLPGLSRGLAASVPVLLAVAVTASDKNMQFVGIVGAVLAGGSAFLTAIFAAIDGDAEGWNDV